MLKAIEVIDTQKITDAMRMISFYKKDKDSTISVDNFPLVILGCCIKDNKNPGDFIESLKQVMNFLPRVSNNGDISTEDLECVIEATIENLAEYLDESAINKELTEQERYREKREKIKETNREIFSKEDDCNADDVPEDIDMFSERRVSRDFCEFLKGNYIYNIDTKQWHRWTGKVWEIDEIGSIQTEYNKFSSNMFSILEHVPDPEENRTAYKKIIYFNSRLGGDNVIVLSSRIIKCLGSDFNKNDDLLNVGNGTIEFKKDTYVFRPHKKEDMISFICNTDYLPEEKVPDIWINHIKTTMRENDLLMKNIQFILGYTLQGGNPLEKVLIATGTGRNGKSVALRTLSFILGDYSEDINPIILMENGNKVNSPERLRMRSKRLILAQETRKQEDNAKDSFTLDTGFLKAASGRDKISLRDNHSNVMKDFYIKGLIVLSTNNLPRVNDNTVSFWDRLWMLPFQHYFEERDRDPDMDRKMQKVSSGILNWCLEGWKMSKKQFVACDAVKEIVDDYMECSDEYAVFIKSCVQRERNLKVNSTDLFLRYKAWCMKNMKTPTTDTAFHTDMKVRFVKKHTNVGNAYLDIRLKENWT